MSTSHSLLSNNNDNNIELHGVVERCSFEQGLCSWEESEVDTPDSGWRRYKGQEAWPELGPHRDHTKNSAAGIKTCDSLGMWIILRVFFL